MRREEFQERVIAELAGIRLNLRRVLFNQQSEEQKMSQEHDETLAAIQDLAVEEKALVATVETAVTGLDTLTAKVNALEAQIAAGGTPTPESFQDVRDAIASIKADQVAAVTKAQADPNFPQSTPPVAGSPAS